MWWVFVNHKKREIPIRSDKLLYIELKIDITSACWIAFLKQLDLRLTVPRVLVVNVHTITKTIINKVPILWEHELDCQQKCYRIFHKTC